MSRYYLLFVLALLIVPPAFSTVLVHSSSAVVQAPTEAIQNHFLPFAPVSNASAADFELGYSTSSLMPISNQVPIYTFGDDMYVSSQLNGTVSVTLTGNGTTIATKTVVQNTTVALMTFTNRALPTTTLSLNVTGAGIAPFGVNVDYVNPTTNTISSVVTGYSVSSSDADMSFNFSIANKYNMQACLTNELPSFPNSEEAMLSVPNTVGSGTVGVAAGPSDTALIDPTRTVGTYDFSFELVANYSYSIRNSPGIITTQFVVAQSSTVLVTGGSPARNQTVTLNFGASLRGGRYTLRGFFYGSSGTIQGVNTQILIASPLQANSGNWFWLGSCTVHPVTSAPYVTAFNLLAPPSQWPRYLYLMYQNGVGGIDVTAFVPLSLDITEVKFVTATQLALPSYLGISLASGQGPLIKGFSVSNGSAFLICNCSATQYPVNVGIDLTFGGNIFDTVQTSLVAPYSSQTIVANLSNFVVQTQSPLGTNLPGAAVVLKEATLDNVSTSATTNLQGMAQFYLPPGTYSLVVTDEGNVSSTVVQLNIGNNPLELVPFNPAPPPPNDNFLLGVLTAVTVVGIIGNLWIWVIRRRRLPSF